MANTKFKGSVVNLAGNEVNVGDKAPELSLVGGDLSNVSIGGSSDKNQVLVVVPSIDTPVCASETKRFNEEASNIGNANIYMISMDLPFASERFCQAEGIANVKTASDFVNKDFSNKYGVLIADGPLKGLSARAIFIINKSGEIVYKELVEEITSEPNYEEALNCLKSL